MRRLLAGYSCSVVLVPRAVRSRKRTLKRRVFEARWHGASAEVAVSSVRYESDALEIQVVVTK
jgi:hypothetical protein